ncbi:hypothetical protein [Fibrobacter succinogenes]|uniref:hypothetical protein n=1 Tax=Fibrobacter succinogenes TaxID=833 RepID=UPI0026EF7DB3|nr:hypothetical protein [Fibrobacter succinogenes]
MYIGDIRTIDHRGLYPAVHVFGVALYDAVNPVADSDARKNERKDHDDVEDNGQHKILAELVGPYQADRLGVGEEPAFYLFLCTNHFPFHEKSLA